MEFDSISDDVTIIDTKYCSAIRILQDLFYISKFIQSRVASDITDPDIRGKSVSHAIEETLSFALLTGNEDISERIDENGKRLVFLSLLTPFSKDKSKLAEDDDGNLVPIIISMLLPDKRFNLSELAITYDINLEDAFVEQYGPDEYNTHVGRYKNSVYVDLSATYYIMSRHQPFLLMAMAFSVFLHSKDRSQHIKALLIDLGEGLRTLEERVIDSTYAENPMSADEARECAKILLENTENYLTDVLTQDDDGIGGDLNWFEFHTVYQSLEMLIGDQKYYLCRYIPARGGDNILSLQLIRQRVRKMRERIYSMRVTIPIP